MSARFSKASAYLSNFRATNHYSHCLLDGGKFFVGDEKALREAIAVDANDVDDRTGANLAPAITEHRTMFFPEYVDADLVVPIPTIPMEAILEMAKCMNNQAQLFFPGDETPLRVIVCTKTGTASPVSERDQPVGEETLYKHGIHFYWPSVIVNWENCMRMRLSFIAGLDKVDWTPFFNVKELNWNKFIDEAVYGKDTANPHKGLRMVFAPKAVRCSVCKNNSVSRMTCKHCSKHGYIYDHRYYKLCTVLKGQCIDEEASRLLMVNKAKLLNETSVRTSHTEASPGWLSYDGCPGLAPSSHPPASSKSVTKAFGTSFKTEISNDVKEAVFMELLLKFSDHYAQSSIRMVYNSTHMEYRVALRGEGSSYCLNLKDFHNSQNVYMVVRPHGQKSDQFIAVMKCFCKCNKMSGGRSVMCSMFESRKCIWLDQRQKRLLYDDVERPLKKAKK